MATAGGSCQLALTSFSELLFPGDDVARIWDTNTGECLQMLTGHTDSIACIKFNRDGTLVATGGLDALVMVSMLSAGQEQHVTRGCRFRMSDARLE